MNANTISTISTVLGLINPALGVIGSLVSSFGSSKNSDTFTKVSGQVQDAASVVTALAPLVQQFANGSEVTPEDVRAALAGSSDAIKAFDDMIAQKEREAGG